MEKISLRSAIEIIRKGNGFYVREYMPHLDEFKCIHKCVEVKPVGNGYMCKPESYVGTDTCIFIHENKGTIRIEGSVTNVEKIPHWYKCTATVSKKTCFFFLSSDGDKPYTETPYLSKFIIPKKANGIMGVPKDTIGENFIYYSQEDKPVFLGQKLHKEMFVSEDPEHENGLKKLSFFEESKLKSIEITSFRICYVCLDDDPPEDYAWGIAVTLPDGTEEFLYDDDGDIYRIKLYKEDVRAEQSIVYKKPQKMSYVTGTLDRSDGFFNIFKSFDKNDKLIECKNAKSLPEFIEMFDGRKLKATYVAEQKGFKIEEV